MHQLVDHAVSGQFAIHVRLEPVHPSAAHFVGVPFDVGGPRTSTDTVSAFEK